jgi:hypothetical protein
MNETRTTRKFTAPSGKEVEVKTHLNVKEHNQLKKTLYGGVQIAGEAGTQNIAQNINGAVLVDVEEKAVELALVKYGENSTDPAKELMNQERADDYIAIVKELESLTSAIFTKAK